MPEYFKNRELSWLQFNSRVLNEAERERNPLFERLRFLGIVTSNLDEFYMIRVGGLLDQRLVKADLTENKTNLTADQQLNLIYKETAKLNARRDKAFNVLSSQLKAEKIHHLHLEKLSDAEKDLLKDYFDHEIAPLLSAQVVDNKHPFPNFLNKQSYIVLSMNRKNKHELGIISINSRLIPQLFVLPSNKIYKFAPIEDLIHFFGHRLFKEWTVLNKAIIKVTRNADLDVDEAYDSNEFDFRDVMRQLLKKRSRLSPVRLEMRHTLDTESMALLRKHLNLPQKQIFKLNSPLSYGYLSDFEFYLKDRKRKDFFYPPALQHLTPYLNHQMPLIPQILKKDVFYSFPYDSILSFTQLLKEAANDPNVISIKITLYRVASESSILQHLILASEQGKDVTVVMELKARFDESNNIEWSSKLEEAGCHVIYGVSLFKVHSKICLILRKDARNVQMITHISTGNYNEKTAKQYTDVNLLTADPLIGQDAIVFFNALLSDEMSALDQYQKLLVSPSGIKKAFLRLIDEEIAFHQKHNNGHIIFKMNSLTDYEILNALVKASQAGVKIELIVRGICCIIPGIEGYTENITVRSLIGRYLEHSRIYLFAHNGENLIYISSADLMTRNMDKRVELACPIIDEDAKKECLRILKECLNDDVNARIQDKDGNYSLPSDTGLNDVQSSLFTPMKRIKSEGTQTKRSWLSRLFGN